MNLEQVADELYALAPAAFTAARDEQAGPSRAAGDACVAGEIKKLRLPTASAWLVNLLAREDSGQVDDLLELGQSLREAQQALDGDRLRELSAERRRLVAALTQEVQRLAAEAGQAVSAQVEREVQDTLEAALAEEGMADAVLSGRLPNRCPTPVSGRASGSAMRLPSGRHRRHRRPGRPRRPAWAEGPAAPRDGRETKEAARARREAEAAERARQEAEAAERNPRDAAEDVREAQAGLDEAEQEVAGAARSTRPCSGRSTNSSGSWIRSRANRPRPCGFSGRPSGSATWRPARWTARCGAWPRPRRRSASTRTSRADDGRITPFSAREQRPTARAGVRTPPMSATPS